MNLRQLNIFTEVCREMNMSRAAKNLYISQSSVSQVIQELEQEYRVRLFDRLAKKIYLTGEGQKLLFHASQVLYAAGQLSRCMEGLAGKETLRIGAATTVGACLLHPLVNRFHQEHPQTEISAEIANSGLLKEKILSAKLDMAILQGTPDSDEIEAVPVFEDSLIFVCPKGHPFEGKEIPVQELSGSRFVLREEGSGTRKLLESFFLGNGLELRCGWVCPGIHETKQAVMEGRGLSLLSGHVISGELREGRLGTFQIRGMTLTRPFSLIWHRDKYRTGSMEDFKCLCQNQEIILNLMNFS